MKHLTKLSFEEVLELCKGKHFYQKRKDPIILKQTSLGSSKKNLCHCFEYVEKSFVSSGIKKIQEKVVEEILERKCAGILLLEKIEQGKTYRFIEGDPIVFSGKVLGYIDLRELRDEGILESPWWAFCLILRSVEDTFIFLPFDEYDELIPSIELSEDQSNLPMIK